MKHTFSPLRHAPLLALCAVACGSDDDGDTALRTATLEPSRASAVLENYAEIVHASYSDSLSSAQELDAALTSFLAAPSEQGLDEAREAWLAAREPYLQTEVYRFYEGPIDNATDGPEGLINAWPLDEQHIDYVVGDEDAGMINDPQMALDKASIEAANGVASEGIDGEKAIATGYHAIEFLLWGQDFNDDGPGDRPYTDYVTDGTGTADNQERRGQYLAAVSELLLDHLQSLVDAWAPDDASNYRAELLAEAPESALTKVMSGMIILSGFETGGERLQAALDAADQEEEHSCFSDNTHRDMVQDVRGIQNVWLGTYAPLAGAPISGEGVRDLIAEADADLAERITTRIEESLDLAEDLEPPFDQEIAPGNDAGRARVRALSLSLFEQRDELEQAFQVYGLTPIPEPE